MTAPHDKRLIDALRSFGADRVGDPHWQDGIRKGEAAGLTSSSRSRGPWIIVLVLVVLAVLGVIALLLLADLDLTLIVGGTS